MPSNCRSTSISTFACRRRIDFGRRSKSALSGLRFLRYLSSVGSGFHSPYARWMDGRREIPIAQLQRAFSARTESLIVPGKHMIYATEPSVSCKADSR